MALHTNKDKQMAARLKAEKDERRTGRCCICNREIPNGTGAYHHYLAHSFGASD